MPRNVQGKSRHTFHNADGELCMTVVDPVTRKLLIPTQYIFETRAQQRGSLPSLCQLFLSGRCRQGQGCYQVHADWEAVQRLRSQVDSLPCCCPAHGDKDHIGVLEQALLRDTIALGHTRTAEGHHGHHNRFSAADLAAAAESTLSTSDVVLYVPGCSLFEGSYVPLDRVSYTVGLHRILVEQRIVLAPSEARVSLLNESTGFPEEKIVADGSGATVCRLHAMDRCRYAEECKFLHLCKDATATDPHLTASTAHNTIASQGNPADPAAAGSTVADAVADAAGAEAPAGTCDSHPRSKSLRHGSGARTTAATTASATSAEASVRQSVFTSISLQQQQQQQLSFGTNGGGGGASMMGCAVGMPGMGSAPSHQQSYCASLHYDPSSMMAMGASAMEASIGSAHGSSRPYLLGSASTAGGPLLVPQRDDASNRVDGIASSTAAAPYLSKSFSGYRIGAGSLPQRPPVTATTECGVMPHMMNASTGSFPGGAVHNSLAPSTTQCGFSPANGNRIRVALSLPAISSTSALTCGAALGTSNSSEKTNSPPVEGSLGMSTTSHQGLSRSTTQMHASPSNTSRWQHNPYLASWAKTDAPHGYTGVGGSSCSLTCHPASSYPTPIVRTV
ncbi:hypothetical protein NESM_000660700 [Novymonas esmeraldas]|uniref:C3H1-type domain-containing protein n=1 Tax=Novymonas esmeraldas TaxID=1808958 RepID=A0AAW0ESD9_9TRYP